MNTIILGGTHQENDYNTNIDVGDRKFIYEGCCRMMPSIKGADIVKEMVGLRPGRSKVRLEHDTFATSKHIWLVLRESIFFSKISRMHICHFCSNFDCLSFRFLLLQSPVNFCK